jgi:long-subunit fatty acid transport protein
LVYVQPLKRGVVSFGGQYSGFELFSTSRAGIGYALALNEALSMGVQINYMNIRQPAYYGTKHGVSGEFGLGVKINPKWTMAMAINNLTRNNLAEYQNERFETILRIGTTYKVSKRVLITSELDKDITFPLSIKAGVEYAPAENVFIRLGGAVNTTTLSLGFGYKFKNLHIDISSNYWQPLGFQTSASLHFILGSVKND